VGYKIRLRLLLLPPPPPPQLLLLRLIKVTIWIIITSTRSVMTDPEERISQLFRGGSLKSRSYPQFSWRGRKHDQCCSTFFQTWREL